MKFSFEKIDDIIVINVNLKRATYRDAEEFKYEVKNHIDKGFIKIIIDLNECEFMDSTFLGTIVFNLKAISRLGGNLIICSPHSDARAILEITGAVNIFDMYETREAALESFK